MRGLFVEEVTVEVAEGQVAGNPAPAATPPPIPKVVASDVAAVRIAEELQTGEGRAEHRSSEGGVAMSVSRGDWFSKLAVWVGGVALLMAGFYMVKYSIDSGWLTPAVRVWTTAIFGAFLCAGGFAMSRKSDSPGNLRIG